MTTGAIVLMVLGSHPPLGGPFCLSAFYRLNSVDRAVRSVACQTPNRWNSIEIFFSGTKSGGVGQLAVVRDLADASGPNCHFVICNGSGGDDGEIQATERWQNQWSARPGPTWHGSEQTIRVCLVGNGDSVPPTDYQLKRLELLLESLCRKFRVPAESVFLPRDCE